MEQAVIAYLPLTESSFGSERERMIVADLAGELEKTIREHGVGEFDGEEFGGGQCVIYMYGRDADLLFAAVEPIVRATPLATGGRRNKAVW